MAYQIEAIAEEMGKLDATNCSSEDAIANYILNHLRGYKHNGKGNGRILDVDFVKVAIQSYAKLIQDAGVKII